MGARGTTYSVKKSTYRREYSPIFCIRYFLKLGFLDGIAGFRWHFSALAYARRVRVPTGCEPPQGAVTARDLVSVDSRSGDRADETCDIKLIIYHGLLQHRVSSLA